ncbi:MAG: DNA polymerase III subunit alpha, partial [Bacteroidetes bacterium]
VMVYQEDVLKVAHYFAGLTLEEADILRRGMSWKFRERNEFHRVKQRFFENCKERGYADAITAELWRQIESFANYAFAKGHSASYAVESYQSLYLKAHFPREYMVATINNGGGFYRPEIYIHEARMHGARIEAPCVNHSRVETRITGKVIWLGFHLLKSLEMKVAEAIVKERERGGPFSGLSDFLDRVAVSLDQLILLIRIGAFRHSGKSKKELLWKAHFLLGKSRHSQPGPQLFRSQRKEAVLPPLESGPFDDAYDETELLGFPLGSPFALIANRPAEVLPALEMARHIGENVKMLGYLVHVKNVATRQNTPRHMQFGCFIDEAGHFIDTVHFPPVAARWPFRGRGVYLLEGRVLSDYDALSLEVRKMEKMEMVNMVEV